MQLQRAQEMGKTTMQMFDFRWGGLGFPAIFSLLWPTIVGRGLGQSIVRIGTLQQRSAVSFKVAGRSLCFIRTHVEFN